MHASPSSFHRPWPAHRRAAALALLGSIVASGCVSHPRAPERDPEAAVTAPRIVVTRQAVIPGPPDEVFRALTAEDVLPRLLTGYGPLPAVVGTSGNTGPWDRPGSARVVHLTDGGTAREQLIVHEAPGRFAYRVWAFTHPIVGRLAEEAHGDWTFASVPGGTEVTWTYTFTARGTWAALPMGLIARLFWRGYMDVCLDNAVRLMRAQAAAA